MASEKRATVATSYIDSAEFVR